MNCLSEKNSMSISKITNTTTQANIHIYLYTARDPHAQKIKKTNSRNQNHRLTVEVMAGVTNSRQCSYQASPLHMHTDIQIAVIQTLSISGTVQHDRLRGGMSCLGGVCLGLSMCVYSLCVCVFVCVGYICV
eukprot:GHVQ01041492.1.p1 GENE.GHVQ01041492.1~~GHVQ01041492.1.p1  ORF type:complete len:132 (+),score=21.38 GHVQ01041492.1:514-909(+)